MKRGNDQRGLMLVELLITVGITVMLVAALGSAIFQFTRVTEQGNDQFRALHDVQNAGHWIVMDGRRAETTDLVEGAPPVESMTLSWTDRGQVHTSTYSLSSTDLRRNYDGIITTVARYVSSVGFSISSEGYITVNMTSSPGGRWEVSEETIYKVYPRPTG